MPKANSAGSIVGMRRRGRFCASCRTWRDICGRKFPSTSWNEKRMLKATHRPQQKCRPPSANCSREYFAGGPLERKWGRGLRPVSGLRPGPLGGCAPATCSRVKNFSKRRKHPAEWVGNLQAVAIPLPYRKLKSERRPDGGASLLLQAHRSIIKCCIDWGGAQLL